MAKVDLITGFLGAGKTTFIHKYLHHLRDRRVLIIENEFGSIGVDAGFLKDEEHPYAFIVFVEQGGGGLSVATPIANTVLQAAMRRGTDMEY